MKIFALLLLLAVLSLSTLGEERPAAVQLSAVAPGGGEEEEDWLTFRPAPTWPGEETWLCFGCFDGGRWSSWRGF